MHPTLVALAKASRRPLTPKRGNKDYYKGTRQAFLPHGRRTGAPGQHVVKGKAKYRLIDEKVRFFVAPPVEEINNSKLKPYVDKNVKLTDDQRNEIWGKLPWGGLTGKIYLDRTSRPGGSSSVITEAEGSS
ncbi:uncharacterized protein STEHIDRAFT_166665 [Stereum hirsutum FP-91666 SS1]|uniref:uncharacterized protein n=1 Tax=Stereum hirsutum (strain FP-91666) TaxID=721885 RepID=UPI000440CCB9|nr:uncharacterized protein STEHIDRAFT_166665 [Stereum hirsutum FP-91666 SS1]EIM90501.1 hypothetical protein STEHIDRAFT_166665 [Stereum hirsutum FP-91666 SS1]